MASWLWNVLIQYDLSIPLFRNRDCRATLARNIGGVHSRIFYKTKNWPCKGFVLTFLCVNPMPVQATWHICFELHFILKLIARLLVLADVIPAMQMQAPNVPATAVATASPGGRGRPASHAAPIDARQKWNELWPPIREMDQYLLRHAFQVRFLFFLQSTRGCTLESCKWRNPPVC